MSSPKYFQQFPNIQYALNANKAGKPTRIAIKDYFNLLVVRDDIFREETLYNPYIVQNGERPDEISYKAYGDEQFYWVILQINSVVDYYNQWPLKENELEAFILKKYGGFEGAGEVHHYETREVKDLEGNLLLPRGLTVDEDFIFYYPAGADLNATLSESKPISITNRDYERKINIEKSQIYILDKKYIWNYSREVSTYGNNLEPLDSFVDISDVNPRY